MHIKTLIVDSIQLLVSSANFTAGGMQRNIEFGIRTTGRPASDAKNVLSQLLRGDYFEEVI
jgi:phosphatidylserine/phosphatidylglycerophosphate/cardiolipin synthase-like enzyme